MPVTHCVICLLWLALLQNSLLPETATKVVRDTLTSLLTAPPSFEVAANTRQAVKLLSECASVAATGQQPGLLEDCNHHACNHHAYIMHSQN